MAPSDPSDPSDLSFLAGEVARTIESHQLAGRDDRILVAFSGGADSTALALLLVELGFVVVLGHVDHGIRPDSYQDAQHCARTARRLSLELIIERVVVEPPTEARARERRYEALEKMRRESSAERIATGHTKDDQAETVVMRLQRGGFPLGIPYRRGRVIRPILDLRRAMTERICESAKVDYLLDPTNYDLRYRRNVVRHSVLAGAQDKEIQELSEIANETRALIERLDEGFARATAEGHVIVVPGRVEVRRELLTLESPRLRRHILARSIESVSVEPSSSLVRDIEKKVLAKTGSRLDLSSSRSVWTTKEWLVFGNTPQPVALPSFEVEVPGSASSDHWGFGVSIEESSSEPIDGIWEQVVSGDDFPHPTRFSVRQWKPGDRFHPLGARGSKKLQDFFVDSGVPRDERLSVPVLDHLGSIVWIVGMRIDDRFKITDSTRRALKISVFPTLRIAGPERNITAPS